MAGKMTTRRGFLASILAAGVAPVVIGSGILMPVRKLWVPPVGGITEKEIEDEAIAWATATDERGLFLARGMWPGIKAWMDKAYGDGVWSEEYKCIVSTPKQYALFR